MSPKRQSLWKRLRKLQKRLQSEKSFVKIKVLMIEINKIQQSLLDDSENTEREEERKATENLKWDLLKIKMVRLTLIQPIQ